MANAPELFKQDQDEQRLNGGVPDNNELANITGMDATEQQATEDRARQGSEEDLASRETEAGNSPTDNNQAEAKEKVVTDSAEPDTDDTLGNGYSDNTKSSKYGKFKQSVANNKLVYGALLGGLTLPILVIILLALVIGPYKAVSFAESVAGYQFARTLTQMSENTGRIVAEKTSIDAIASDSKWASIKNTFNPTTGKSGELWSKLDKFRPNKTIANFKGSNKLIYNTERSKILGRDVLKSVTIEGKTVNVKSVPIKGRLVPGYELITRDIPLAKSFTPDFIAALKAESIGPITRARIASQIRSDLSISLVAWMIGKYAGATPEEAKIRAEREALAVSKGEPLATADTPATPKIASGASSSVTQAATDAATAEQQALADTTQAKAVVANPNETPAAVQKIIDKEISSTAVSGLSGLAGEALGIINPIYKWAVPLCLIYDGSIVESGPSIDANSDSTTRTGVHALSTADQLKNGYNVNAVAVGANDWKLGKIQDSVAQKRASGQVVDTSGYASTEASPTGQYSYSIADMIPGPIGPILDGPFHNACPSLTNVWVGVGLGIAQITVTALSAVPTGGESILGKVAVESAAESAVNETLPIVASSVLTKIQNAGSFGKNLLVDTGKQLAWIGAATLVAKSIVLSQMGSTHNVLAVGQPYDDSIDDGVNKYSNMIEQRQFYGAPLQDKELNADNANSLAMMSAKTSSQSAYQRYLAINNYRSLANRLAMIISGYENSSFFSSLLHNAGLILNPLRSLGSIFGSLFSHSAFAATNITSVNTYYGNVQFGYTTEEKKLMTTESYGPLENQLRLDNSGQEAAIAARYGKCFDGSETIGQMLSSGDIRRDNNGNVIANQGLCSPDNLGPHNHDKDAGVGMSGFGDLVFRWRVAQSYNNTIDQLTSYQDVTP